MIKLKTFNVRLLFFLLAFLSFNNERVRYCTRLTVPNVHTKLQGFYSNADFHSVGLKLILG